MARDPPIFQFWKVGKSTILRRNALSTTQILTKWVQKIYRDIAWDPPIFRFWKVRKSTNLWQFVILLIYRFWKVENFGKSTILRRNAQLIPQIVIEQVQKVYRDMARDPPIFDFYHVQFLKASGKFTILQRNVLLTTQMLTH